MNTRFHRSIAAALMAGLVLAGPLPAAACSLSVTCSGGVTGVPWYLCTGTLSCVAN